jgi:hypothetical protein
LEYGVPEFDLFCAAAPSLTIYVLFLFLLLAWPGEFATCHKCSCGWPGQKQKGDVPLGLDCGVVLGTLGGEPTLVLEWTIGKEAN